MPKPLGRRRQPAQSQTALALAGLRSFARDPDPQPGRSMQGRRRQPAPSPNLRVFNFEKNLLKGCGPLPGTGSPALRKTCWEAVAPCLGLDLLLAHCLNPAWETGLGLRCLALSSKGSRWRSITKGEGGSQPQAQTFGFLTFKRLTRPPRLQQGPAAASAKAKAAATAHPTPLTSGAKAAASPIPNWPGLGWSEVFCKGSRSPARTQHARAKAAASPKPKPSGFEVLEKLAGRLWPPAWDWISCLRIAWTLPEKQALAWGAWPFQARDPDDAASPRAKAAASPKPKPLGFGAQIGSGAQNCFKIARFAPKMASKMDFGLAKPKIV